MLARPLHQLPLTIGHHYKLLRSFSLSVHALNPIHPSDIWFSKALSTSFLLAPSSIDLYRSLNVSPFVAFLAVKQIKNPISAYNFFNITRFKLGIDHSIETYMFVITLLCQSSSMDDALKLFDEMLSLSVDSLDENFLGFVIDSCVVNGFMDSAIKLLSKAQDFGYRINPCRYNNIMTGLINKNRVRDAISFFKNQLILNRFVPDIWSFNIVLKACSNLGDIEGAKELFDKIIKIGYSPDRVTYNILLDGLCKANQADKAYEMLKSFQKNNQSLPNVITYTSIISGYCKMGKMNDAHKVFDEMIEFGIKPSQVTYNILIDGYGKAGIMKLALNMYDKMLLSGIPPDIVTITSLINGYCLNGQLDEAMKLWHNMGLNGLRPNLYTFSIMIHSLCKFNRLDEAIEFLIQLIEQRKDLTPKAFVYNPILDGLCRIGKLNEANSLLARLKKNRGYPDKYTFTIMMIGHCMKGRINDAIALYNKMKDSGCEIDCVATRSLVSCLLKAGLPDEADKIMMDGLQGKNSFDNNGDFCLERKGNSVSGYKI